MHCLHEWLTTLHKTQEPVVVSTVHLCLACGLLQMRAGHMIIEKQQQQAHEAALVEAHKKAAQAREAERAAAAKAVASNQVGGYQCSHHDIDTDRVQA